ncbi:hypothetical protein HY988_05625 [Candidatus Micrarchaeota archaeon]|nr:hypothetical protein [Candidatus Micrarchaeota archaeon]
MFESIGRSLDIVKRSFALLMEEKKLVIFPLISGIVLLGVLISFIVPTVLVSNSDAMTFILVAAFYFVSYFFIIFFNTALVHAVYNKMNKKEVSVIASLSFASSRLISIVSWAAIAATVGLILSILRGEANKQRGIGGLIAGVIVGLIGMAWSMATYFVVPIMTFENVGPFEAIKRSVMLIKKTWGEEVVGGFGIGIIFMILYVIGVALAIGAAFLTSGSGALFISALAMVGIYFVLVFLIQSTIQSIFVVELYRYAMTGQTVLLQKDEVEGAFKAKVPQKKLF